METAERIIIKTYELFMRYGIRSVSMDDIAFHLGISKKTIYQYYADKDALVDSVLDIEFKRNYKECENHKLNKENAVHEIFLSLDEMQEFFKHLNPTIIHDIQKYHPNSFKKLSKHKEEFIYNMIKNNLESGIKEGLYRPEINVDILTKFHIESIFIAFNTEIFPSSKYQLSHINQEIIENFLYGIVSIKGVKKIQQYKRQRQNQYLMNQKTLNQLVGVCCFLLVAITGISQPVYKHAFSLKDCVDFAHKNNVQVKNALLNLQIQKQINKDVTSAAMPTLSANIGGNDYLKIPTSLLPGEIFGQPAGSYIPVQFGTKFNANAGIQLQQVLFDGQVFVGLKTRNTSIEFQNKNIEVTEELIKTNVYKIYYQLVASKSQITIFDANLDRLNKLLKDAKILYENGFVEKLDLDKIAVQISNLETEKLKANNSIEIGYLGLKTLIGMPVKDTLELTDPLNETLLQDDLSLSNDFKYQDRKDYQYIGLAKKMNEFNIQRYQMSYLPTITLSGNYSKNAQRKQFDFFGKGDWFSTSFIGLNLNIPIFSGFSKDAKLQKSRLELKQTENQINNLQLSIDAEIEGAKMVFRAAIATLGFQKQNMQLAENVYNQTKKKFELGTGSNTEITAAQTDLRTAQTNYISALYSAISAKIDFTKAVGKL